MLKFIKLGIRYFFFFFLEYRDRKEGRVRVFGGFYAGGYQTVFFYLRKAAIPSGFVGRRIFNARKTRFPVRLENTDRLRETVLCGSPPFNFPVCHHSPILLLYILIRRPFVARKARRAGAGKLHLSRRSVSWQIARGILCSNLRWRKFRRPRF